jgi:hypothetical protein
MQLASRSQSVRLLFALAAVAVSSRLLVGHHSFAMFDSSSKTSITGTVTRFEWTNPHVFIEVDVPGSGGELKHWSVELGSPSILLRSGWKFTDVKPGDKVTAIVNPLRDGRPGGMLYRLTLPDGSMRGNGTAPPADPPAARSAP